MSKRVIIFLILTVIFTINSMTFAGQIKVNINDEPVENSQVEDTYLNKEEFDLGALKINGGPMISIMKMDLKEFNENLPKGFSNLSENLILKGGGGLVGSKNGSRIGGYGLKGSNNSVSNNGERVNLELYYGGFLYEKAIYSGNNIDISLGSLFGGGSAKLDLVYGDFKGLDQPYSNSFHKSFMVIEPRLNMHYQLAAFLGIDLSIAYFMNLDFGSNDWKFFDKNVNLDLGRLSSPTASLKFSVGF